MGKGSLLSGQAKKYKGNQKHKSGCPKGKLASKLVSNTENVYQSHLIED